MTQARHDLPANRFPFTIFALNSRDGDVVWQRVVTKPEAVYIPPLAKQIGCPVNIKIVWADGTEDITYGR